MSTIHANKAFCTANTLKNKHIIVAKIDKDVILQPAKRNKNTKQGVKVTRQKFPPHSDVSKIAKAIWEYGSTFYYPHQKFTRVMPK